MHVPDPHLRADPALPDHLHTSLPSATQTERFSLAKSGSRSRKRLIILIAVSSGMFACLGLLMLITTCVLNGYFQELLSQTTARPYVTCHLTNTDISGVTPYSPKDVEIVSNMCQVRATTPTYGWIGLGAAFCSLLLGSIARLLASRFGFQQGKKLAVFCQGVGFCTLLLLAVSFFWYISLYGSTILW